MKTCSTVNGFVSRKPAALQCAEQIIFVSRKVEKKSLNSLALRFVGPALSAIFRSSRLSARKKIVRFSFGCLDALGQTRKQQGKSTVNARVGEKHERNFFCLFNYCLNDWKTETTCYKYFILLCNIRQKHWLWPLSYFTFSVSMQSPLLSEISQLAFIQRAQYHVENTCVAILNNPAAGF